MKINDESWQEIVGGFYSAAVGNTSWIDALSSLADATGSKVGELIGFGPKIGRPIVWNSGDGNEWAKEMLRPEATDPGYNPFMRGGLMCQERQVIQSAEFISKEERKASEFLQEHCRRWDVPNICLSPLIRDRDATVGLAVLRSEKQGEITQQERKVFASIAPHVRAAVQMQLMLEQKGALLMAETLEALSLAAFVCDKNAHVQSLTPSAERLLRANLGLKLVNRKLCATSSAESQALARAIGVAAAGCSAGGAPVASTVIIGKGIGTATALEVLPVPTRKDGLQFEPRVLVVGKEVKSDQRSVRAKVQEGFSLTAAEAEIAIGLAEGLSPAAIAAQRRSAIGTVRKQIRSICEKMGCHRQSEIGAKVNKFR